MTLCCYFIAAKEQSLTPQGPGICWRERPGKQIQKGITEFFGYKKKNSQNE
jgi:hypothetical protein